MRLKNGDVLFIWPLALHVITAGWTYNNGSAHNAIDLRAVVGTPVYAMEDGTVDQTQFWDGRTKTGMQSYGNMLRIRHAAYKGGSLRTRYGHLSRILVEAGQAVKEGDLIGYSGETGNCNGAHLHIEVIYNGARVNPLNWMDADFTCANSTVRAHLGSYISVQRPATGPNVAKLQRLCIIGQPQGIADNARALGLPVDAVTITLIGPASSGDAMTLWGMAKTGGCEYFARYAGEVDDNTLQRLCIAGAGEDIHAKAAELGLPVADTPALLIGPASNGDAMTLWRQAQASSCEYFARYTE